MQVLTETAPLDDKAGLVRYSCRRREEGYGHASRRGWLCIRVRFRLTAVAAPHRRL
eukprot:gene10727-biopygen1386